MNKYLYEWQVLSGKRPATTASVVDILLANRGLKTKEEIEEFFNPRDPVDLNLSALGIDQKQIKKAVNRVKNAIQGGEKIIIYGDYDADGVCSTAILWECLYAHTKKVTPYLPDRFSEGYGINAKSIKKIKAENPDLTLIITVDNGIVAGSAVDYAKELDIDVIITDHHQIGEQYPNAYAVVHTDKISGSGVAWVFAREIQKSLKNRSALGIKKSLELAAIGTIADQLPLVGPNRSIAKYGLFELNTTDRTGLLALYEEAGISTLQGSHPIGTYEINYLIAPRINAMGRIKNAMVSLRLLCTSNKQKAKEYAYELGKTNKDRQDIVDQVVLHAKEMASKKEWNGVIVLADESYHEGVIGLAAGKLVEEYGRPAIVLSKGVEISKASARSISGFNIIENIRKMDAYILGGGGHPMAAGFSIETSKIETFITEFEKLSGPLLTKEVLQKVIKIDCELDFSIMNFELVDNIKKFEPIGMGNYSPVFVSREVKVLNVRLVGSTGKHLKLKLQKDKIQFDAIYFNGVGKNKNLETNDEIDVVFNLEENIWNGQKSLQLKIKDIHFVK